MRKMTRIVLFGLLVLGVLALSIGSVTAQDQRPYRIVVVTHGQASDPFWSVVANGVNDAARDMRVTVEYQAPGTFDMVAMAQLIDAAVASNPDALVVSLPDADALGPSIEAAVAAGIPVMTINSGSDVAQALGAMAHIGQTEYEAGYGAGQRMAAAGATNALCVNQEVGNAALDLRCQGFTDAMGEAGGAVNVLAVELADPTGAQSRIAAALAALDAEGLLGTIKVATFDLSPEVLQAIVDGNMLFAVDQQQYLQGYLPIVYLTLYLENLNTPGQFLIPTGPGFVTQDTAATVIEYSARGTR